MLHESAYNKPPEGLWPSFDRVRKHLEDQEINPIYEADSGLESEALKAGFAALEEELSSLSPAMRKAKLFEYLLKNARISVDTKDWIANFLDHQNLLPSYNARQRKEIAEKHIKEARDTLILSEQNGLYTAELDLGHISPGWRYMFKKGLLGLLEEAAKARAEKGSSITQEQIDFYDSLEIVYNAIIAFCQRLSIIARELADKAEDESVRIRMLTVADSLSHVPAHTPRDFHEALQFSFIMHQMIEMEGEFVRSMAGFDRSYFEYYEKDIKANRLTKETAKELIKFFFTKFFAHTHGAANGKNFYFGGQKADGTNAENELTFTALEAYYELNTTDPKLSVRVYQGTSQRLLDAVSRCIRDGRTGFVLVNDEAAIPAILSRGKSLEEAREYLLIGCYEPTIEGREISCNMSIKINLSKGIELALNRGRDLVRGTLLGPDTGDPLAFNNYEDFEKAYFSQLKAQVESATNAIKAYEPYWADINPSPVLAGTFIDCIERGLDIGRAGPKYNNTGCMGAALANAADSLMAVKKLIFEERKYSTAELIDMLKKDFKGYEQECLYIKNRIPKWGNNNEEVDNIAIKITSFYGELVNSIKNNRGGNFMASLFSLTHRYNLGEKTSALPDGRKNGEVLSLNVTANTGMDREGVTALLLSLSKIDYQKIPNGSVADVYLHPSAVAGKEGLLALQALIKTFFKRGGFGIQFNIFDINTLKDAQKHPENYQTLQIRVCGWNVYFVTMSPHEQEQYILSNVHAV